MPKRCPVCLENPCSHFHHAANDPIDEIIERHRLAGNGHTWTREMIRAVAIEAANRAAVALGRKGGLANKGIPKPASAANGSKGGRPKGSKNKPKPQPQSV